MLLTEAISEFLEYLLVELNRSEMTRNGYKKDLDIFVKFLQQQAREGIIVDELTHELFSEYLRYLSRDRGCRANTIRRHITAIKSLCSFLVNSDYLEHNPAAGLSRPRMPKKHPRHLKKDELERIFVVVNENGPPSRLRDKTVLMSMYYSGVRVSEVVNIRREDLDFDNKFLKVTKGKGKRFRKIPLHLRLEQQLNKYLSGAPELVNDHLFCNRQGRRISTDYVHYITAEYARKAGINRTVTPHMFRHSFATHLYNAGIDIATIARLLGHAGIRNTTIYIHSDLKRLRRAVEKLNVSRKLELEMTKMEGKAYEPTAVN